eukprot:s1447_g13.t1
MAFAFLEELVEVAEATRRIDELEEQEGADISEENGPDTEERDAASTASSDDSLEQSEPAKPVNPLNLQNSQSNPQLSEDVPDEGKHHPTSEDPVDSLPISQLDRALELDQPAAENADLTEVNSGGLESAGGLRLQRAWQRDELRKTIPGGVEYRPNPGSNQVFRPNGPPPADYPVQVESNNAMANQPAVDHSWTGIWAPQHIVGRPRLITAKRNGDSWSFTSKVL